MLPLIVIGAYNHFLGDQKCLLFLCPLLMTFKDDDILDEAFEEPIIPDDQEDKGMGLFLAVGLPLFVLIFLVALMRLFNVLPQTKATIPPNIERIIINQKNWSVPETSNLERLDSLIQALERNRQDSSLKN